MKKRRGFGTGRGQGYLNLAPMDSLQHSLNAKGVKKQFIMPPERKDPVSMLMGKGRRYDFGMIPTPQKKGLIKEIARKVHQGVDWAIEWEKKHLPAQKEWVKKEYTKAKELAVKGLDKVKDYAEQKKADLDDVRDELDHNDDGVQDISYETLTNTNLEIQQGLNTIDLDNSGVPDHLEDGTFAFTNEDVMTNQAPMDENKGTGFPFPTLNPQAEFGGEEVMTNIQYEPTTVEVKPEGAGFPFPSLNPKKDYDKEYVEPEKTFGQKVKGTAVAVGGAVKGAVKHEVQKRQLQKDFIRHLSDRELETKAIEVGKPLFGGLNAFEKEIIRRRNERRRLADIKSGKVESKVGSSLGSSLSFLNPLSTFSTKPNEKTKTTTKTETKSPLDLSFLNPLSTFKK